MSPFNIDSIYEGKTQTEKLIATVMIVAKEYQPGIIYMDEAEKIWPAKGKKRRSRKKKTNYKDPTRIKTILSKWKSKILVEPRVTIVACTNVPHEGSKTDFKKFFDKSIYFPFPDYTTRRLMWKTFIERKSGRLDSNFPLSTLAHITAGYSAGSIRRTIDVVLSDFRVRQLK